MLCRRCRQLTLMLKNNSTKCISWYSTQVISTETAREPVETETGVHYSVEDVTNHSMNDYLKFYTIPKEATQTNLVDVLPVQFKNFSRAIDQTTIMLRRPSLHVISQLKENPAAGEKFLFYGSSGTGKTISLVDVVYHCLQSNWLVIFVPNAIRFMDSQKKTDVQESQWNPSRVDQPQEAATWLKMFKNMNYSLLTQLKTTQDYSWGKRESTEKNKSLIDVLDQGVSRSLFSTDAVGVLLKEIRQQKDFKVLYAVDAFNSFYGRTSHKLFGKQVDVENLALRRHFLKLLRPEQSLQNGRYLLSLSQAVQYLDRKANPCMLDEMLEPHILSSLGDIDGVEVENFTEDEYLNIMKFYKETGWLTKDLTQDLLQEIRFVTGCNPKWIQKYCASL